MEYFVNKNSIVRQIWGKSDTILLIFAGASAEFALNKAVDWLYFTGRLPLDPLGRLFSTVSYARAIVFSEKHAALRAIDAMATIHAGVEAKRNVKIPDWAYRDVLFMLIDYSVRSFEVLERKLNSAEKNEVFQVFNSVGSRMGVVGLPETFDEWETMRREHLEQNMQRSNYTDDLFRQYRKHLGLVRYKILLETQTLVVPPEVRELLGLRKISFLRPLIAVYKVSRTINIDWILKAIVLPVKYKKEIRALDASVQIKNLKFEILNRRTT
jgi:uncharacterized protein (DUF2236 family)